MKLEELLDRPIAFHRPFVAITGNIPTALMLSQAIYWQRRATVIDSENEKWFWKTQEQWEEETGLTRYEQEAARKKLIRLEILKEKRAGVPARMFFQVDTKKLAGLIESQSSLQQSDNQDCSKAPNKSAADCQSISENTPETLAENTPKRAKGIPPEPNASRLSSLFNRRLSTKWTQKELRAWNEVKETPDDEIALLCEYYGSSEPYLRRDLQTLLNNLPGEIDRARAWKAGKRSQPNGARSEYTPIPPVREKRAILATGPEPEPKLL